MTTLSGSPLTFVKGFDDYISGAAAHDQSRPGGPSARVELMSTLGDCQPDTYVSDLWRTRLAYGKADLEIDAYSYVLSHAHEELDPTDDSLGPVAHELAREWAREAWPGRQVKIVTQRDNGRWEEDTTGQRAWVEGKWHSHVVVASVAEQAVELKWTDAKRVEQTKHYAPGRAVDGDLKNIFRLRHSVDAVVLREWQYDNAAYVEACRRFSEGSAAKQDLAQRAERGYSSYDEVRAKLRTAAAQAPDWDDFVARCQAGAVDVRVRGKGGVSYSWVGDDGLERKARARGQSGLGAEFAKAEVEKRCELNAAALARGEQLEVPEQVLVVPTSTLAPDRPRPQYLTADGRPPWESGQNLDAYAQRVRETGGTYEGRLAQALLAEAADPASPPADDGVELSHDAAGGYTATVDAGYGPVLVDLHEGVVAEAVAVRDRALLYEEKAAYDQEDFDARERKLEDRKTDLDTRAEKLDAEGTALSTSWSQARLAQHELIARARTEAEQITAEAQARADEITSAATAEADTRKRELDTRETELESEEGKLKRQAAALKKRLDGLPILETDAESRGLAAARTAWDEVEGPELRRRVRAEVESTVRQEMADEKSAAVAEGRRDGLAQAEPLVKKKLEEAEDERKEAQEARLAAEAAATEAQRRLDQIPVFDPRAAVDQMTASVHDELRKIEIQDIDSKTGKKLVNEETGKPVVTSALDVAVKKAAIKDSWDRDPRKKPEQTVGERRERVQAGLRQAQQDVHNSPTRAQSQNRDGQGR